MAIRGATELPAWQSIQRFDAKTTVSEKVWRVVHHLMWPAAAVGLYSIFRGAKGNARLLSYVPIVMCVRKVVEVLIFREIYPASKIPKDHLRNQKALYIADLERDGYKVQQVSLAKSGTVYDAVLIGKPQNLENGKWQIHAPGNGMPMEHIMIDVPQLDSSQGFNTLLINGPNVGESTGWTTRYQLGAGIESGLQFLEQKVKATYISMYGHSIGGAMTAEAVLQHEFTTPATNYLSVMDRTFSRISDLGAAFVEQFLRFFPLTLVGKIVYPISYLTGIELDGVAGARKMQILGIRQIIVQHENIEEGSDGLIPDSASLFKRAPNPNDVLTSCEVTHNGQLPQQISVALNKRVQEFFAK